MTRGRPSAPCAKPRIGCAPPARRWVAELSMGMTDDFEVAVEEGATIVRVGRALFGDRSHDDDHGGPRHGSGPDQPG